MEKKNIKSQIHMLVRVNQSHIQKQENEILKLIGKQKIVLEKLDAKDLEIQNLIEEKAKFKISYFKSLPSKLFTMEQMNFYRNSLESFNFKVKEKQTEKEKIEKELVDIQNLLLKHRQFLKKYAFKNEKYDYLKANYG